MSMIGEIDALLVTALVGVLRTHAFDALISSKVAPSLNSSRYAGPNLARGIACSSHDLVLEAMLGKL